MKKFKIECNDKNMVKYLRLLETAGFEIYGATSRAGSMEGYSYLSFTGSHVCRGDNADYEVITIGQAVDRKFTQRREEILEQMAALQQELDNL